MSKDYITEISIEHSLLPMIFGSLDIYLKKIEKQFSVSIVIRNEKIKIIGGKSDVIKAKELIDVLKSKAEKGSEITEQDLNYCMDMIINRNDNKKIVIDFIAGMTDDYFLNELNSISVNKK